jgi:hypothetical protein
VSTPSTPSESERPRRPPRRRSTRTRGGCPTVLYCGRRWRILAERGDTLTLEYRGRVKQVPRGATNP